MSKPSPKLFRDYPKIANAIKLLAACNGMQLREGWSNVPIPDHWIGRFIAAERCAVSMNNRLLTEFLDEETIDWASCVPDDTAIGTLVYGEEGMQRALVEELGADGATLHALLDSVFEDELHDLILGE